MTCFFYRGIRFHTNQWDSLLMIGRFENLNSNSNVLRSVRLMVIDLLRESCFDSMD